MGNNIDDTPEQLIRDLVVMGTPDECRAQLARFVDAGVTTLLYEILPIPRAAEGRSGPDAGELRETLKALPTSFPT
jgi:alkanesulfonate monooxygenase SsuD/methylene tetrahydromethanopterin reductase-like flavin-dependent oxidoreductase (luciferase family)